MHVLLVDGRAALRARVADLLREAGASVALATDHERALVALRRRTPDVAIVVHPGTSGSTVELLPRLKHAGVKLVAVLTSDPSDVLRVACTRRGADFVLDEVRDFETLVDLLALVTAPTES
jgi:DNA-binding response OmpR family regulator